MTSTMQPLLASLYYSLLSSFPKLMCIENQILTLNNKSALARPNYNLTLYLLLIMCNLDIQRDKNQIISTQLDIVMLKSVGVRVGHNPKPIEGKWNLFVHLDEFRFRFSLRIKGKLLLKYRYFPPTLSELTLKPHLSRGLHLLSFKLNKVFQKQNCSLIFPIIFHTNKNICVV